MIHNVVVHKAKNLTLASPYPLVVSLKDGISAATVVYDYKLVIDSYGSSYVCLNRRNSGQAAGANNDRNQRNSHPIPEIPIDDLRCLRNTLRRIPYNKAIVWDIKINKCPRGYKNIVSQSDATYDDSVRSDPNIITDNRSTAALILAYGDSRKYCTVFPNLSPRVKHDMPKM